MNSQKLINKSVSLLDISKIEYVKGVEYQKSLFDEIISLKSKNRKNQTSLPTKNYFIFCEHNHVYTLGKNGNNKNFLADIKTQKKIGASFHLTNRGGDITYHGPEQIVGYPIIDLENFFTDLGKYMRGIEEVIIETLNEFSIKAERSAGETGVWIDTKNNPRKICAIGVKTSRWVTMHGFALNVNNDLSYFDHIVPCGITNKKVTSMKNELNVDIDKSEVKRIIIKNFTKIFGMKFIVT